MNYLQQYHQQPQILHNQRIGFAPHLHDEVEIVVLFQGSAVLTQNGQRFPMEAGDIAFLYPGCVHGYASETAVDVGKFIFSPRGLAELEQALAAGVAQTPVIRREQLAGTGITALATEILERYNRCTPAEQHAYLFLLAARLLPLCPPQESREQTDVLTIHRIGQIHRILLHPGKGIEAAALHIRHRYRAAVFQLLPIHPQDPEAVTVSGGVYQIQLPGIGDEMERDWTFRTRQGSVQIPVFRS